MPNLSEVKRERERERETERRGNEEGTIFHNYAAK